LNVLVEHKTTHVSLLSEALRQLKKGDTALYGKSQPLIIWRFGRFHLVTTSYVVDLKGRATKGVVAVNFMSATRAKNTIGEWLPYSELKPLQQLTRAMNAELDAKLLPTAQDYLPLLRTDCMQVVGGSTTDTLHGIPHNSRTEDVLMAAIDGMMKSGAVGPFLSFKCSHQVIQKATRGS